MKTTYRNLFRIYRQTLSATFANPGDAEAATLAFRDMPPGMEMSLSSRWDDSNPRHLDNARAIAAAGAKATFYLNASDPEFVKSTVRPILALGHSVGIHTKTHPFLMQLTPGGLFDEILGNRVAVESAADTTVNAFTLPFGTCRSRVRPGFERLVGEALRRTGIFGGGEMFEDPATMYGLPRDEFVGALHYGFDDRHPSRELFLRGVSTAEERFRTGDLPPCGPHVAMGTHSWADDDGMAEITRCFELRTRNPAAPYAGHTWFCTENEFAASWIQARHTRIVSKTVDGVTVTWTLERVEPAELGANVPLFLQFGRGTVSASVSVDASGQAELPHAEGHSVPVRIDAVFSDSDAVSAKFPGVSARLVVDHAAGMARLHVENRSGASIDGLAVVLRLPLCYENGFARTAPSDLPDGGELDLDFDIGHPKDDFETSEGPFLADAQIDFSTCGEAGRIHAVFREVLPVRPRPDTMRDAARVATALPAVLWTDERLRVLSRPGASLAELDLFPSKHDPAYAGNSYHFHSDDPAWKAQVDAVPANLRGRRRQLIVVEFDANGSEVLFDCHSPADCFVNGTAVKLMDGARFPTLRGRNRIVLALPMDHWKPRGDFAILDATTLHPLALRAICRP